MASGFQLETSFLSKLNLYFYHKVFKLESIYGNKMEQIWIFYFADPHNISNLLLITNKIKTHEERLCSAYKNWNFYKKQLLFNLLLLFVLLYFMEFAINPHKIIRKAKVKSLLTSQGSLHYLLSNYNCLYGKTEILL